MHPTQIEYAAFSISGDKNWGELVCHKTDISYRNDYKGSTLVIDFIKSEKTNCGLGTKMINFAKNISRHYDCNGYLLLKSESLEDFMPP